MKLRKIHPQPLFASPSFENQVIDWVDESGAVVIQERAYFPYNWFKKPTFEFWLVDKLYFDEEIGVRDSLKFNFKLQKSFYAPDDDLTWFPIFSDLGRAVTFLNARNRTTRIEIV